MDTATPRVMDTATAPVMKAPGPARRLGAFGLDYLLILCYLVVLGAIGSVLTLGPFGHAWGRLISTPARLDLVAFVTAVLPVALYFTLLEGSSRGATWGKRRMRVRVVRVGGGELGKGRALLRSAVKLLPWQLAHTCLLHIPGWPVEPQQPPLWVLWGMSLVWVLVGLYVGALVVRKDRRTPYDWVAGSEVVVAEERGPEA